jgi:hypothetical protein
MVSFLTLKGAEVIELRHYCPYKKVRTTLLLNGKLGRITVCYFEQRCLLPDTKPPKYILQQIIR